jgi:hypothetical protein
MLIRLPIRLTLIEAGAVATLRFAATANLGRGEFGFEHVDVKTGSVYEPAEGPGHPGELVRNEGYQEEKPMIPISCAPMPNIGQMHPSGKQVKPAFPTSVLLESMIDNNTLDIPKAPTALSASARLARRRCSHTQRGLYRSAQPHCKIQHWEGGHALSYRTERSAF